MSARHSLLLLLCASLFSITLQRSLRSSSGSNDAEISTKTTSSKSSSSSSTSSSSSSTKLGKVDDLPKTASLYAPIFLQEKAVDNYLDTFLKKYGLVGNEDAPPPSKNQYYIKSPTTVSTSSSSSSSSSKTTTVSTSGATRPNQFGRRKVTEYGPPSYPPPADDGFEKYAPPPLPPPEDEEVETTTKTTSEIETKTVVGVGPSVPTNTVTLPGATEPTEYHSSTAWIFAKITKGNDCTSTQYMTAGVKQDTCLSMGGVGVVMTCDEFSGWVVYHEYAELDCSGAALKSKYVGSVGCNLPPNGYLSSWWAFEDDKKQKSIHIECQPAAPICRNPNCVPSFGKGVYNTWKVYASYGTCNSDDYDLFEAYQVDLCIPSEGYFEKNEASTYFHYSEEDKTMAVTFYEDSLKCKGDKSKISLEDTCTSGATNWAYSDESIKRKEQHELLVAIEEEEAKLAILEAKMKKHQEELSSLEAQQEALNSEDVNSAHP